MHLRPNTEGLRFAISNSPPQTSAHWSCLEIFGLSSTVNLGCNKLAMVVSLSLSFSLKTSDTHFGMDIAVGLAAAGPGRFPLKLGKAAEDQDHTDLVYSRASSSGSCSRRLQAAGGQLEVEPTRPEPTIFVRVRLGLGNFMSETSPSRWRIVTPARKRTSRSFESVLVVNSKIITVRI